MNYFDIIYNATNKVHIENMECQLRTLKEFILEFDRSKADSEDYHIRTAKRTMHVRNNIKKSDEVVFRTVCALYGKELVEIGVVALQAGD